MIELEYDSEGFAERARKLIAAGQPFRAIVRGQEANELKEHLAGDALRDPSKPLLLPRLRLVTGIVVLSDVKSRAV